MSPWLAVAALLLLALAATGWVCLRGSAITRLVGLETASVLAFLLLLVLAQAFGRAAYLDVALTLAFASFLGSLALLRFLERWL